MKKVIVLTAVFTILVSVSIVGDAHAFTEQRKFIGEEYDATTDLNYLNARYYNAKIGRFVTEDPMFWSLPNELLTDPQQLNSYSYARNNPIVGSDPTGLLTIIVPGTNYNANDWSENGSMSNFISSVNKTFNETNHTEILNNKDVWSGGDNIKARQNAADYITKFIKDYNFSDGEQLNIVGHSHGGNIANLVSQSTSHKIDNLVTLGTPVRSDYMPNTDIINRHINVYSNLDPVQSLLGGEGGYSNEWSWTGAFNKLVNHFTEFGLAGRKYNNAENINVTGHAWNPFTAHGSYMSESVWSKVDKLINK